MTAPPEARVLPEAVVLFGASGFVGRNLAARLAGRVGRLIAVNASGMPVPGADATLPIGALGEVPALPRDTVAIHVAAPRYDAARFATAQADLLAGNIEIANRIYGFCAERGIAEVRMASSVAVYPAERAILDDAVPVDLHAPPHPGEAFYAWSKRWAEIAAGLFRERYGINTIAFRLSNPYGPYDALDEAVAHVLPAFVIRALRPGEVFTIRGDPQVERDFIHVDDVVAVFERSLRRRGESLTANLCSGTTTSLQTLAETILRLAGVARPIAAAGQTGSAVLARRSTNALVRQAFGDLRFTSLEDGLSQTIDWYRHALEG
ncbi:NAD-dependent epimerase/dehydratase family protein [Methylobacterium gregans]|uniref:dTDP-4-oxo-6-deoxy-D-allose reductase n=1 Tax=Methylobacterium gregans TaxID=374424 RepID=A0AA37HLK7_9HYPH|nr:NAD(P)-dependent oxidoreductase [Methylobacterium gregans]MDQ0521812.1 nucleoside-diphosphate-sugar epimerase [Methylobacterium gregans]GJD77062.1 dTDP-4-oxo-6-deoxy-D-allose reductase [Methylobacterium gregans]GLS52122.1 hypothetical protein GCM10007886_03040 [Methylobacterium gregans]